MRNLRWIIFLPAAVLAFASPVSANTFTETFDDNTYDLSVQLGTNARWCSEYSNQYGTSGPSLCLFNTSSPTVFVFPDDVQVQGFEFVAGAKNGTVDLTVVYDDETTGQFPIDGSCCEVTVQVIAPEGQFIESFSVPADRDLWLFDSLVWVADQVQTSTTTTEPSTTVPESSTTLETTTTSTSTTSSVPTTAPPPPPAMPEAEQTTVPETSILPSTSVAPSTTETPVTTLPPATSTIPSTSTLPATTVPDTTIPPDASGSSESDANPDPVVDTGPVEQPPSDAPLEQKLEFESKVDVFSGEYDEYVPVGSTITVAQRRTVVAVTAVLIMFAPPPTRMRRT